MRLLTPTGGAWISARFVLKLRPARSPKAAFDPDHGAGARKGLEKTQAAAFPVPTGVSMSSHTHQNLTEPVSRGYGRIGGYALIVVIAALLLLALLTNPVLPF
jgi:hypothetical protein